MYCTFCQEAGAEIAGKTDFVTGCTSFKKETLSIHGRSHRHTRARDHLLGKQKPASEGPLSAVFQKNAKSERQRCAKRDDDQNKYSVFCCKGGASFHEI